MSNPFLNRIANRSKTSHGNRSEKRLGKSIMAQMHAGSGSKGRKGDMRKGGFLIESKATVKDSIGVKKEWLEKVENQALLIGKKPALSLSFVRGNGEALPNGDWVAIRLSDFKELFE